MTSATVRDLRYNFTAIEARLRRGETIQIRKRKEVLGTLVPAASMQPAAQEASDFTAFRRALWGKRKVIKSATELIREDREKGH